METYKAVNLYTTENDFLDFFSHTPLETFKIIQTAIYSAFENEISKDLRKKNEFIKSLYKFINDNNLKAVKAENVKQELSSNLTLLKQSFDSAADTEYIL